MRHSAIDWVGRAVGLALISAVMMAWSVGAASADHSPDCGPPAEDIPGPPAWAINVGQPMTDAWLLCYIWHDVELQDYQPQHFGEVLDISFAGYPVECVNDIAGPAGTGTTDGLQVEIFATGDQGRQRVRFIYRIQDDGDYINNCVQELLVAGGQSRDPVSASGSPPEGTQ